LDGERTADAGQQVLALRERLQVGAARLQVVVRVREQRHDVLREPVGRGEGRDRRVLHDGRGRAGGDRATAGQDRGEDRLVELARAGDGVGDELDLVEAGDALDLDDL